MRQALPFGALGRPHGLRGDLVLRPFNPEGAALDAAPLPLGVEVVRADDRRPMSLTSVRRADEALLVHFAGVEDRDAAAALTGAALWVPRTALPRLGPGEFYVEDLVGCAVVDLEGRARGVVRATFWNGVQDVLSVEQPTGEELLVPAVPAFIRLVDLPARRVVVDPHE